MQKTGKVLVGLVLGTMLSVGACQAKLPKRAWFWGGAEGKIIETVSGIQYLDGNLEDLLEGYTYGPDG